jgi:hypothetical protein
MRIITRKRIYRAFPELDQLSDYQCEQLMRRMQLTVWRSLVVGAAAVGVFFCSCCGTGFVLQFVEPLGWRPPGLSASGALGEAIRVAYPALLTATSLVLALLARDVTLGFFLRRSTQTFLRRTTCPGCKYQLIGQTVDEAGGLRCPECGRPTTLTELGLDTPEDLVPEASTDSVG